MRRRADVGSGRVAAHLLAVAAVLLPASAAWGLFVDLTLFQGIRMDTATWVARIGRGSLVGLPVFAVVFGSIVAVTIATDFYAEMQRRRLEAQRLRSDLAEARLRALQLQLQPHFLFNTLHAISSLMDEDTVRARRMTARLGSLLRATLELADQPFVSLRREVRLAELYLDIERARFEDRLRVRWRIDDGILVARVPTLMLQPMVENAVRHGVGARSGEGTVEIVARRAGDGIQVEVRDDGVGPPDEIAFGIGLSSIEGRLRERYGEAASLRIEAHPDGGCVARIAIPYEPSCAS